MLTSPPGFFDDVSRHSWGVAWQKRWGHFTVAGQSFKYAELVQWTPQQLLWLLNASIAEQNIVCACWAFEWMLMGSSGNDAHAWHQMLPVLSNHREELAIPVLEKLLGYIDNLEILKTVEHGSWASYLVGKTFASEAAAKKSKSDLQTKKKLALHFLGDARKRIEWERTQPSADPYRTAAVAVALGAAVAAAYESAAYLQWKGTRTTALAE